MDRRQFLERSMAAGVLLAAGGCRPADAGLAEESIRPALFDPPAGGWGLQLYTVRSMMGDSVEQTLATVSEIGYGEVEFAGYFDRSPGEIRSTLDSEGLTAPSTHLPIEVFRDGLDEAIEAALVIGHRYLVLPYLAGPDRPGEEAGDGRSVADGYRELADQMNSFGERCREAGLRFGYHNHDFELEPFDGGVPLDLLIENTDPDLVTFQVDLFWLIHGGADPFDYFARFPGRFELCHIKDRTSAGEMVDVGAGVIDWAEIFASADQAGLRHYFVEHDSPAEAADSVRASFLHLSGLGV